jgi:hypothetical protein
MTRSRVHISSTLCMDSQEMQDHVYRGWCRNLMSVDPGEVNYGYVYGPGEQFRQFSAEDVSDEYARNLRAERAGFERKLFSPLEHEVEDEEEEESAEWDCFRFGEWHVD